MITSIKRMFFLVTSMGVRWVWFRLIYWVKMRSGIMRLQVPAYDWSHYSLQSRLKKDVPAGVEEYAAWRIENLPAFFFRGEVAYPQRHDWKPEEVIASAEKVLSGEWYYFSHTYQKVGFPPDWLKDPFTGKQYNNKQHWSAFKDYGDADIKFVWEASRLSGFYALSRAYAIKHDEVYAKAFWKLLEDWMEKNPPGKGPNWMDGQEAALRLMASCFAYYSFIDSQSSTPGRISLFTLFVAAHAQRIAENLDFARSTHSNHTISEGFGLWLAASLFPELLNSDRYLVLGREILEQEANSQFFADGSYAMYSHNYQRFSMQLYVFSLRLAELQNDPFSTSLYNTIAQAVEYLQQQVHPESGQMPQYGSNDGALVCPLNQCDFTDYRPILQAGYYLLHKKYLFPTGTWDEDLFWLFGVNHLSADLNFTPQQKCMSFPQGGLTIMRSENSYAMIHCVKYRSRPSHADQLHLDFWWYGKNIAIDAGTYLYNGPQIWKNVLAHTQFHNTITVDGLDQMQQASRITWVNWADGEPFQLTKQENIKFSGFQHNGYKRLNDPVIHQRIIALLEKDRWLIVDHLLALKNHHYCLHWLLEDLPYELASPGNCIILHTLGHPLQVCLGSSITNTDFSTVSGDLNSAYGWRSLYYAEKFPALSVSLSGEAGDTFFWTYFGGEKDKVNYLDGQLIVNCEGESHHINLKELTKIEKSVEGPFFIK